MPKRRINKMQSKPTSELPKMIVLGNSTKRGSARLSRHFALSAIQDRQALPAPSCLARDAEGRQHSGRLDDHTNYGLKSRCAEIAPEVEGN